MKNELENLVNINLNLLSDEASKLIFTSQVYYNMTGEYSYIARMLYELCHNYKNSISSERFQKALESVLPEIDRMVPASRFMVDNGTMFFDPQIVTLGENEVFCDCGALEMATSLEFAFRTDNKFSKIYAFEPDPVCHEMCEDNLKMFDREVRDRVFLYDIGLDDTNGSKPFERSTKPGNSKIIKESEEVIRVKSLDSMRELNDITFLKIHTEGNELAVVKGAAELIKKNKPIVAVSIYHNLKELVNIPIILRSLVPEYRLYMRHYSSGTSESVLYAVTERTR